MTNIARYMCGDPILSGDTSPEAIARYVFSFQSAHKEVATGWPDTSPIGLRYLAAAGAKRQRSLLDSSEEEFHQQLINELREKGDKFGSTVHMAWRLTRQVKNFATNYSDTSQAEMTRDIAVLDSDLVEWTKVEPAFRYGSSLVLSDLINLDEVNCIHIAKPQGSGDRSATVTDIGNIRVRNSVLYSPDNESIKHSTYDFTRMTTAA